MVTQGLQLRGRRTPAPPGVKFTQYAMRNLRVNLRDRARVYAALTEMDSGRPCTLEHAINMALEKGLDALEAERAQRRKKNYRV